MPRRMGLQEMRQKGRNGGDAGQLAQAAMPGGDGKGQVGKEAARASRTRAVEVRSVRPRQKHTDAAEGGHQMPGVEVSEGERGGRDMGTQPAG